MAVRKKQLVFDASIGGTKPENIVNTTVSCPFCDRNQLTDIIASDGPILLFCLESC